QGSGTLQTTVQTIRGRRLSGMCYTSRDYRAEQEARRKREESRDRQTTGEKAGRDEKTETPKRRDRELVRF
ncbi:MAG: hypothetical protein M3N18_06635, partial [Actinomycetota bacterium]|nr:hypothetical protein [Actinomycetota bacterium]